MRIFLVPIFGLLATATVAINRNDVITRAKYWESKGISYSMSKYYRDPEGKNYRTDCSGYVSMAWKLQTSYSTVSLPEVCHRISKDDLRTGDIVMRGGKGTEGANGHVVIFEKWADAGKTRYHANEQTPPKTKYSVVPYPYHNGGSGFVPYRYKNIQGGGDGGGGGGDGGCSCCKGGALGEYCGSELCGSCIPGDIYGCNAKNAAPSKHYGRCSKGCTVSGDGKSYCNK